LRLRGFPVLVLDVLAFNGPGFHLRVLVPVSDAPESAVLMFDVLMFDVLMFEVTVVVAVGDNVELTEVVEMAPRGPTVPGPLAAISDVGGGASSMFWRSSLFWKFSNSSSSTSGKPPMPPPVFDPELTEPRPLRPDHGGRRAPPKCGPVGPGFALVLLEVGDRGLVTPEVATRRQATVAPDE
jgi:hypothetical protein